MGQMVLADDDLNVNAEIVFIAEDLDNAAPGILGGRRPADDLAIDNEAFQILPWTAAGFSADDAIDLQAAGGFGWRGTTSSPSAMMTSILMRSSMGRT